jgi:hypothetical protein
VDQLVIACVSGAKDLEEGRNCALLVAWASEYVREAASGEAGRDLGVLGGNSTRRSADTCHIGTYKR